MSLIFPLREKGCAGHSNSEQALGNLKTIYLCDLCASALGTGMKQER